MGSGSVAPLKCKQIDTVFIRHSDRNVLRDVPFCRSHGTCSYPYVYTNTVVNNLYL